MLVEQQVDGEMHNEGKEVTKVVGRWCRSCRTLELMSVIMLVTV